jgi:DNA-directed RNA polymerase subunit E'/Rpb7
MIMSTNVSIHPSKFDSKIKDHIKEHLLASMKGNCDEERGYISSIGEIVQIGAGKISHSYGHINFIVKFNVVTYKPAVNDRVEGKISTILPGGFFVDSNNMRIFVPIVRLAEGTTIASDENENMIITTAEGKTYSQHENVDITIISAKYDDQQFKCIGEL